MRLPKVVVLAAATTAALTCPAMALAQHEQGYEDQRYEVQPLGTGDTSGNLHLCIMMPFRRCETTVHLDLGLGGGRTHGALRDLGPDLESPYLQLFLDGGVLFWLTDIPVLHLGPTVGFETQFLEGTVRYQIFATVRARLWLGEWVTVEGAIGPKGTFDEEWNAQSFGGLAELAMTIHGHLGAYVQAHVLGGRHGEEVAVTGGIRGSFLGWIFLLVAMGQ